MVKWKVIFGNSKDETAKRILDYKKADFDGMRKDLHNLTWSSYFKGSVNVDWKTFKELLRDLESKYVIVRQIVLCPLGDQNCQYIISQFMMLLFSRLLLFVGRNGRWLCFLCDWYLP